MKKITCVSLSIFVVLCLLSICYVQKNSECTLENSSYKISNIKIYYSHGRKLFCFDLPTISMQEFLSLPDLKEIDVRDSTTISIFEKSVVNSKKDTIKFVLDTIIIDDINFDLEGDYSSELSSYEEKNKGTMYSYGKWDNGIDAYMVVKLFTNNGIDTLAVSSSVLSKIQFNNTVFSDSLLFYVVADTICERDSTWIGDFQKYLH